MHVDLFSAGHSREEVYRALGEHQVRDHRSLCILDLITIVAVVGASIDFRGLHVLFWVLAIVAGSSAIRHFVDMSNRTFFMHRIDWERAIESEAGQL